MIISAAVWDDYRKWQAAIRKTAARRFAAWLNTHEYTSQEGRRAALDYAFALVTNEGARAAALACEMYNEIAASSGLTLDDAMPAETADFHEVAKTVNGIIKDSENADHIASGVERLVKQADADTMLQNAARDGAEWAWIPKGKTCAFCLTLASNDWQPASKKILEGGHVEHIHANCDCEFAIRFDGKTTVEGYDPKALKAEYDKYHGDINAWQSALDAEKREADSNHKRGQLVKTDVTSEYYKTASPSKGSVIKDPGFADDKHHIDEVRTADLLQNIFGNEIHLLAETNGPSPDYLWRNTLWDLKTPQSESNITKRIQKGLHQIFENPGGIVCDIRLLKDVPIETIEQLITERMQTSLTKAADVIIIDGDQGKIIKVLRYRK